ncbi:sigma-70 family RNA polymerase sigma factor [Vagococcus carniphilus]|uniref:Sigma-70 family RNA polymerase sigma factor n=1 Tax=Vagococcus carniphilus TaxID=218144 RepID=A0AAW8U6E5_9ENTE|nr:sigma-70 family RNA polymerase sigma factor [Vagococcus carniphilus]MDT2815631.1 sigma-70 family RNA polymerase sigma factor [Vagococcus carniphilus]MDT2831180.1 sigma-70 family RNA polymerase sigma factor [Vagococcus carniphilus]MDT2833364.1 sigma-70 family RNA polymerase sigma factor [Vagococcus carniphilus]MDT2839661.1 sigma-70 family RNA polymerase sigma factor [Vagococcus carniphilus]MDT2848838.1 sigma-70 family RNA polymerase sigma factor [Vagococcus carniphilus]
MLNQNELLLTQAKIGCSDAFEELFQKYVPIVLKQKSAYYLRDYDLDDWLQEGRIVCFQSLQRYNIEQDVTFGLFFKINFKRRVVTLLRHQEAQKRQIYRYTESLESQVDQLGEHFSKCVEDYRAGTSIEYIFIRESLEDFSEQLSKFEIKVYIYLLLGEGLESIASILDVSVRKVTNGYSRLRKKVIEQLIEE